MIDLLSDFGRMIYTSKLHSYAGQEGAVKISLILMDECELLHVEYNTITPVIIIGTGDT